MIKEKEKAISGIEAIGYLIHPFESLTLYWQTKTI